MEKAVILDVDGTLVDSNYEHVRAWHRAFRDEGITIPQATIHRCIGMGGDQLVPRLLQCDREDPRARAVRDRHGKIYRSEYLPRVLPLPGVDPLFERLREAGCRTCIATSAHREELDHYLDLLHLRGRLDAAVSKDDVEASKPSPDVLEAACRKLQIEPGEALFFGDTVWDGEAAQRVGMAFVALLTGGYGESELRGAGAIAVYRDLPDLLARRKESPLPSG